MKTQVRTIVEYCQSNGLSGHALWERCEALGRYLDDSARNSGRRPKGGRPLSISTTTDMMKKAALLLRWSRYKMGYREDTERTALYLMKLKEAEGCILKGDR